MDEDSVRKDVTNWAEAALRHAEGLGGSSNAAKHRSKLLARMKDYTPEQWYVAGGVLGEKAMQVTFGVLKGSQTLTANNDLFDMSTSALFPAKAQRGDSKTGLRRNVNDWGEKEQSFLAGWLDRGAACIVDVPWGWIMKQLGDVGLLLVPKTISCMAERGGAHGAVVDGCTRALQVAPPPAFPAFVSTSSGRLSLLRCTHTKHACDPTARRCARAHCTLRWAARPSAAAYTT